MAKETREQRDANDLINLPSGSGALPASNHRESNSKTNQSVIDFDEKHLKIPALYATVSNITDFTSLAIVEAALDLVGALAPSLVEGNIVLVKDQSTPSENGPYIVSGTELIRSVDADTNGELRGGTEIRVVLGDTYAGVKFFISLPSGVIDIGTDAITFVEETGGGGDVSKVGTPAINQVAVWNGDGPLRGDPLLLWDGTSFSANPNVDSTHTFGKCKIHNPFSGYAGFSHFDHTSTVAWAFAQSPPGSVFLNAKTGQQIGFGIQGGTPKLKIQSTGITFDDLSFYNDNISLSSGTDIICNSGAGNNFASGPTQKFAFWGQTPTTQPANTLTNRQVLETVGLVAAGGADSEVAVLKVSYTPAEIKVLNSSPKDLIPAPGANKMLKLLFATYSYKFVSAAFDVAITLNIGYDTLAPSLTTGLLSTTHLAGANKLVQWDPARAISESTDLTAKINQPLKLHADGDSVAGDGTLDLTIVYQIIDI